MDINKDTQNSSPSTSASPSSSSSPEIYKKRASGRKKFKETRHQHYRGVRQRTTNPSKWVCEVREPNKKTRIWLGTFPNPEMAALAHDVAALALRGDNAPLNFPEFALRLSRPASSSKKDIQRAALQAAMDFKHLLASPSSNVGSLTVSDSLCRKNMHEAGMSIEIPRFGFEGGVNGISSSYGGDGFVDEEAIFNMPLLLDSMAQGMLLTPPGMKKRLCWSSEEEDDHHHIDLTLWKSD